MDELCQNIIEHIEKQEISNHVDEKLDTLIDRQIQEHSIFGVLFVAITTLVTNLWAQYLYHNTVTNYGNGTQGYSDSLLMLFVYTVLAVSIAILFVIDLRFGLI